MRKRTTFLLLSMVCLFSADAPPAKDAGAVTLMGMLMEWRYPDAGLSRAQMSDAGVTGIVSIKCNSVLSTPDPADKVLEFYLKKLNVDSEGRNLDEKGTERVTTERSVLVQIVSEGNSPLFVIAVNGKIEDNPTSTTLVISRLPGDDQTKIAWSTYRQLGP